LPSAPVVGRPGHPIFRRKAPTTTDLLDYSWVLPGLAPRAAEMLSAGLATVAPARRRALERQLAEQPHVLLSDPHACLEVAARTDCLTGAPEPMVQPYLDAGRLARVRMQLDIRTNIAAVWDPARVMTPAAERLLAALVSPDPGS
jgi:DNA-binding transcriptional LysR family regulator